MTVPNKLLWLVTCLWLAGTAPSASAKPWTEWSNALAPKGNPGPEIPLAVNGKTDYAIVLPDTPTTTEEKAAQDLARWLQEMTDAAFPVVKAPQAPTENIIGIGRVKQAVIPAELGDEGYAIAVEGKNLYLFGGKTRGPINAVYALLEEDLGCRWYAGDEASIPHHSTVKCRPVPRQSTPAFRIRDPYYRVAFDATWSLRNRTNAPQAAVPEEWGGHVDYALFVHTFNTLVPPEKYFADHPEYFMMDDTGKRITRQLCTTNPDVIRIAAESVLRTLKDAPASKIVSVSKNDGGGSCLCPNCKAIDDAEGTNAGSLLHMVNKVAELVEKEFPDVLISTLAYLETIDTPKTIRPRANVAIQLCTDNCMWAYPFTPARNSEPFAKAIKGWSDIGSRIHIWDYCVNFSHYTAPMPNLDVVTDNIRFFHEQHVEGVMEQGAYQSPGAERDLLRAWVLAKIMWDPSRDADALTKDFIWGYFGKAASPIAEYNDLLAETARQNAASLAKPQDGIRYPMDSPFLSEAFITKAVELYDEAERLADNEGTARKVRRDRLPIMYVQLCRGPNFVGNGYADLISKFEKTAREVGLTAIFEGPPDLDQKLKAWREAQ